MLKGPLGIELALPTFGLGPSWRLTGFALTFPTWSQPWLYLNVFGAHSTLPGCCFCLPLLTAVHRKSLRAGVGLDSHLCPHSSI